MLYSEDQIRDVLKDMLIEEVVVNAFASQDDRHFGHDSSRRKVSVEQILARLRKLHPDGPS